MRPLQVDGKPFLLHFDGNIFKVRLTGSANYSRTIVGNKELEQELQIVVAEYLRKELITPPAKDNLLFKSNHFVFTTKREPAKNPGQFEYIHNGRKLHRVPWRYTIHVGLLPGANIKRATEIRSPYHGSLLPSSTSHGSLPSAPYHGSLLPSSTSRRISLDHAQSHKIPRYSKEDLLKLRSSTPIQAQKKKQKEKEIDDEDDERESGEEEEEVEYDEGENETESDDERIGDDTDGDNEDDTEGENEGDAETDYSEDEVTVKRNTRLRPNRRSFVTFRRYN